MGNTAPTPTWHPSRPRLLLVGTAVSDGTIEIWASLYSSKAPNRTPMVKLYMGNSTNTISKGQVLWLDAFNRDRFTGPIAKRDQARMQKIREHLAPTQLPNPLRTLAQSSPPLPPPPPQQPLPQTLFDWYYKVLLMSDEEVKTVRSIMVTNGTSIPPLQLMIKAKNKLSTTDQSMRYWMLSRMAVPTTQ